MDPVAAREAWLGWWRVMARYHHYEVEGAERLETAGPALLVGYHGRPIARDLLMLQVWMHDHLGRFPRGIVHGAIGTLPGGAALVAGMGFLSGDDAGIACAVEAGDQILVTPGGTREGCRSFRHRNRVHWGSRVGYVRLAARWNLPIIPLAGVGVDDAFIGLNDGYEWGRRLGMPARVPAWLGVGIGVWPLALPLPVRIRTRVGEPLSAAGVDPDDRDALLGVHTRVTGAVQQLLDGAAGRAGDPTRT